MVENYMFWLTQWLIKTSHLLIAYLNGCFHKKLIPYIPGFKIFNYIASKSMKMTITSVTYNVKQLFKNPEITYYTSFFILLLLIVTKCNRHCH